MILKFFLLFFVVYLVSAQGPNPTVRIPHGLVQGAWKVSTKGRPYASFSGIPYARPPIGKYRFREPQHLKPWAGVWDATKTLPGCIQYNPFHNGITGSESCLYVNVHTPKLTPGALMPVVVFIHGGAFMYGEGSVYGVSHFMDWNMVVVTLNYRLGPFGFLSTGDEVVPGNNGLKDQSLALHWVKNNIMMFGGNPDSITLTGSSAGGASVHYHYLSPASRGTFARGITFSGSAFASWALATKPAEKARTLASIVGCPTSSNKEMVECMKNRPAEAIVDAQTEMFDWKIHFFTPFTPVVEPAKAREPFLQKHPYHATKAGSMMNVPLIATVTAQEGLYPAAAYLTDPSILQELEAHWDQLAANIFEYNDTLPLARRPEVAQAIKQHYLGGKPVSLETFPLLVDSLSDRLFLDSVGKLASLHATNSGQPTYVYRYAYSGNVSLSNMMSHSHVNYGVSHADDVLSFFVNSFLSPSEEDNAMIEALITMIYSFSTSGTPKLTENAPEWLPVKPNAAELHYLNIVSPHQMEMNSSTDFGQKSFWDSLGFNEGENYRNVIRDEL